jgi:conjugation system TraG family ATPase
MKAKAVFEAPFIGVSSYDGISLLYSENGNFSAILAFENLALQLGADPERYKDAQELFGHIIKLIGADHILQKTDILCRKEYSYSNNSTEYLDKKYFSYFKGRKYASVLTYLTISKETKKGRVFSYTENELKEFTGKIKKIADTIANKGGNVSILDEQGITDLHRRFMAFEFNREAISFNNISCDSSGLEFGEKQLQIVSLIDIDELNLPNSFPTYKTEKNVGNNFPSDNFSFFFNCPGADTLLYNQVVFVPDQIKLKRELELKKKRHSSMPDPSNQLSIQDIDAMFIEIAGDNELLVYSHFSVLVYADKDKINKAVNFIDSSLFGMGIIPGKNTYNQMELFRAAIPGNAQEIKPYDRFLTSRPASVCFFFKETLPISEKSNYLLYFTDRQGIPIGIDTWQLPMETNRISNRNKFILGPSGSGKSFFTNAYVKQIYNLGHDVIIVDTGHSYLGTCKYFGGKYITYREDQPITMNPFKIEELENNEEKRQILKSLISLIWKGVDGVVSQVEDTVLNDCISAYFTDYFGAREFVQILKFDSFYEFALFRIEKIIQKEQVPFDLNEFKYILKKFYRGGEYEKILNDDFDSTLFNERFIVFEIDSIKEHKLLFPITTLIIMDVFIQKMRYKKNNKTLIIEEAWKAIASPMMAGYILYLYKTVRKFDGEAIVVTQELGDIVGNAVIKDSIIANSDTICLLDQSKFRDRYTEISELLSINEIERNKIFTINQLNNKDGRGRFKEVYIRRGHVGEVYGIEVPFEEYLTYTTARHERQSLEIYLEHYGLPYEIAIENMVADLRSSNMSMLDFCNSINKNQTVFSLQKFSS